MAGEGAAIAHVVRAFPGTVELKWALWGAGWTDGHMLASCVGCGVGTVQCDPSGRPNHYRHYEGREEEDA
jgi:hypothetical protein